MLSVLIIRSEYNSKTITNFVRFEIVEDDRRKQNYLGARNFMQYKSRKIEYSL